MRCFRRSLRATGLALVWATAALGQAAPRSLPASAPAVAQQGVTDARQGRFGAAIREYQRALRLDPQLAPARMDLALAYFKTGQIEAAARNFHRYLALAPGDYRASLLLATCDLSLGRYGRAVALTAPFRAAHRGDLALAYIRGTALIRAGQVPRGEVWINRIMQSGDSPVVHLMLGDAYRQDRKWRRAIAEYQRAVAMDPKLPLAHLWLAEAQLLSGQSAAALKNFEAEYALDRTNYETNFYLGFLYAQQGESAKAEPYLRRAHEMVPGAFQPALQLALVEFHQGQLQPARALLAPAVKAHPKDAQGHVILGEIYYRLHQPKLGEEQRAMVRQLVAAKQAQAIQQRQRESLQLAAPTAGGHS
ncbi:MAG: tetratricopeptide repeat protein [Terriglobales bacterium]